MALTAEQKLKLQKLSIEKEGVAFVNKSARATPIPTIVISLGGMGADTLNVLKRKMSRSLGKVDHIYFLAIDTDEKEGLKAVLKSKDPNGYLEDHEVQGLHDPASAMILMNRGINRPPHTDKWMKRPFPETLLDDNGAQGRRQIGRLMLTSGATYQKVSNKIRSIVQAAENYRRENSLSKIEIILLAGISGGTGSGTIIDISYLIRKVMSDVHVPINMFNLSAYVYTPDVQFNEVGIAGKPAIMNNLMRNGYAAIKEIDYFMNLSNHGGIYSLDLGGDNVVTSRESIFDACTIVSGMAAAGGMVTKKTAIENLTENLLDLLTDVSYTEGGSTVQMASAFSSNKLMNVQAWYNTTGSDSKMYPKAANYCYQVLGYSAVGIPKDEILAYCVNKMFQQVHKEFNCINEVDGAMVSQVLGRANLLDAETLVSYAISLNPENPVDTRISLPKSQYPSKKEVKNGTDNTMDDAKELAMEEAAKVDNKVFRSQLKSALFNALKHETDALFDVKGPYYVVELLTHRLDKPMAEGDPRKPFAGVLAVLDDVVNDLIDLENSCIGASNSGKVRGQIEDRAADASGLMAGAGKMDEYVEFVCKVAKKEVLSRTIYKVLREVLVEVIDEMAKENNKIWEVYTEVLDTVSGILQKDAEYATASTKHDLTYTYNVINLYDGNQKTNQLKEYLDGFVSEKAIGDLCTEFIKSMRDNRQKWTDMENNAQFDVVSEVRSIFDKCLDGVLKNDVIEKFVVAAYAPEHLKLTVDKIDQIWADPTDPVKQDALKAAAQEIVQILNMQGGIMASTEPSYNISHFLDKHIVATLADTPNLSQEIMNLYVTGTVSKATSRGLTKYISSHIVYNVPLYLFEGFKKWDEVYRNCIQTEVGLHMDEVGQDWKRFPQPFILDCAVKEQMPYKKFMDYEILMEVKADVDQAMEYSLIRKETPQDANYTLYDIEEVPESIDEFRKNVNQALREAAENEEETDIIDLMTRYGYTMNPVPLTLAFNALVPDDLVGEGRYLEVGDFYKLVRMSGRYMELVKKNLKIMEEAKAIFEHEQAELEREMKFQRCMLVFANGLKTGMVKEEVKYVYTYNVGNKSDILVDVRAGDLIDKTYILYHAFREFCKLDNTVISEMRRRAKQVITGDEDTSGYQDMIGEILGEDFLGDPFGKEELREDVAASELDYTYTDDPTIRRNPHAVLTRFYKAVKRRLG